MRKFPVWLVPPLAAALFVAPAGRTEASCSNIPLWDGRDPSTHLDQARSFLSKLPQSTQKSLEKVADGFDTERDLHVQQALFREDLIWQNRGYTDRQIDLMVFVAVALSLERAGDEAARLCESSKGKEERKIEPRLERIGLYRADALTVLDRLSLRLLNLGDYEAAFYL
jgi:hypothetical protein